MVRFVPKSWGDKLLTIENAKTIKGESLGYLTGILYLAPHKQSGFNTCPMASKGCASACLFTAGHAAIHPFINESRIQKTLNFFNNRDSFLNDLRLSIKRVIRLAGKRGMKPAIRLNGTSDIEWERFGIIKEFPAVTFYDYTKVSKYLGIASPNHHYTFSRSESNQETVKSVIRKHPDINVAVVFQVRRKGQLPKRYLGREVIDADLSDARFLDKKGVICGLRAKGKARANSAAFDNSGFVVRVDKLNRPILERVKNG
jgi:hypothetical protein